MHRPFIKNRPECIDSSHVLHCYTFPQNRGVVRHITQVIFEEHDMRKSTKTYRQNCLTLILTFATMHLFAEIEGQDQPAHTCNLISVYILRCSLITFPATKPYLITPSQFGYVCVIVKSSYTYRINKRQFYNNRLHTKADWFPDIQKIGR